MGTPTFGSYSRAQTTINIVMVDMHDDPGKDEVRRLSAGQAAGVENLEVNQKNNGIHALASAGTGKSDVTIAINRVQKQINDIRADKGLSKEKQQEKIDELTDHVVKHEIGHSLGGTHKGSGGKGLMRDGITPGVAPGPLSPGSKREIKKALRRRKE